MWLGWNHDRLAFGQNRSPRSRLRITGTQMLVVLNFSTQQPFRIRCRHPSTLFGDADRNNFVLVFVDGVKNRRGREQRDLVLSTAPSKQNADPKFFHDLSVWTRTAFRVNRRVGSQLLES